MVQIIKNCGLKNYNFYYSDNENAFIIIFMTRLLDIYKYGRLFIIPVKNFQRQKLIFCVKMLLSKLKFSFKISQDRRYYQ